MLGQHIPVNSITFLNGGNDDSASTASACDKCSLFASRYDSLKERFVGNDSIYKNAKIDIVILLRGRCYDKNVFICSELYHLRTFCGYCDCIFQFKRIIGKIHDKPFTPPHPSTNCG